MAATKQILQLLVKKPSLKPCFILRLWYIVIRFRCLELQVTVAPIKGKAKPLACQSDLAAIHLAIQVR